ncbi:MAG: hypothetical protein M1831_002107 [Alyxoria varia]|nr:MAG: hypothetical protein M1831_002107 [Alyxoria varia]
MQLRSLAALTALALGAQAQNVPDSIMEPENIYTVTYVGYDDTAMTEFSGSFKVPTFPSSTGNGITHYVWPGVYAPLRGGVLQPVLSSFTGQWSINNTWYYGTQEDAANEQNIRNYGFELEVGETIDFSMRYGDVWTSTLSVPGTNKRASASFPMISDQKAKTMRYSVFEVELWHGAVWDFGPVEYSNIKIVSTGTQTGWCHDHPWSSRTAFTASGVTPTVQNGKTICNIDSLIMQGPTG